MKFTEELMKTRSALFLDGWLKFNEETWGVKSERVVYRLPGKELPALEAVLYLDKRGRVRMPPCNPYIPLQFSSTSTEKKCQLYTQLTSEMKLLAEDIKRRGVSGSLAFPPGFLDARAFQWLGFDTTFNYTFVTPLPLNETNMDKRVRGHIEKAKSASYSAEKTNNWNDVIYCLNVTSDAKRFDNILSISILSKLEELLPKDNLYAHIAYDQNGEPSSAQIKFVMQDGICIGWQAGTDRKHITSGVNQMLYNFAISDITKAGGRYFDNCGANIESVARAKSAWGFELVPYIMIPDHSLKGWAKNIVGRVHGARKTWHFIRRYLV
jgi:hypothetical protein